MNRSFLPALGVLILCGAGFGLYYQHAAAAQRQLDTDLADRLTSATLDLLASQEREAMLTENLRAAAARERTLVAALAELAELRTGIERARDDRDVYKSLLEEMLDAPGHRELLRSGFVDPESRARGALLDLHRRQGAMFRMVDETLPQLRTDLASAERSLTPRRPVSTTF